MRTFSHSLAALVQVLVLAVSLDTANALFKPTTTATRRRGALLPHVRQLRGGAILVDDDFSTITKKLNNNNINNNKALQQISRGGEDDAGIDKSSTWNLSEMGTLDFVYLGATAAILVGLGMVCRTMARTGGQAPAWIIDNIIGEAYATLVLHVSFFAVGLLLPAILPAGLSRFLFSAPSVALLGFVFPSIESVRAAVTEAAADDRVWLMYWVVLGIFQYSTEFIDQLALKYESIYKYWHTFELLVVAWLILPLTDGSTLIYRTLAEPFLIPVLQPIKSYCDGWIATLALTTINASYIWWFSFIFMSLPVFIKRYAVMGVGSIFPVAATVMALASPANADSREVMRWLSYWPCFSLLFLIMTGMEKFVGSFKGLYVMCLASILYLMLPMFDGSSAVLRHVLVPLLNQQELLLLRDARQLAADMMKKVSVERQGEARQAAAKAFLTDEDA